MVAGRNVRLPGRLRAWRHAPALLGPLRTWSARAAQSHRAVVQRVLLQPWTSCRDEQPLPCGARVRAGFMHGDRPWRRSRRNGRRGAVVPRAHLPDSDRPGVPAGHACPDGRSMCRHRKRGERVHPVSPPARPGRRAPRRSAKDRMQPGRTGDGAQRHARRGGDRNRTAHPDSLRRGSHSIQP